MKESGKLLAAFLVLVGLPLVTYAATTFSAPVNFQAEVSIDEYPTKVNLTWSNRGSYSLMKISSSKGLSRSLSPDSTSFTDDNNGQGFQSTGEKVDYRIQVTQSGKSAEANTSTFLPVDSEIVTVATPAQPGSISFKVTVGGEEINSTKNGDCRTRLEGVAGSAYKNEGSCVRPAVTGLDRGYYQLVWSGGWPDGADQNIKPTVTPSSVSLTGGNGGTFTVAFAGQATVNFGANVKVGNTARALTAAEAAEVKFDVFSCGGMPETGNSLGAYKISAPTPCNYLSPTSMPIGWKYESSSPGHGIVVKPGDTVNIVYSFSYTPLQTDEGRVQVRTRVGGTEVGIGGLGDCKTKAFIGPKDSIPASTYDLNSCRTDLIFGNLPRNVRIEWVGGYPNGADRSKTPTVTPATDQQLANGATIGFYLDFAPASQLQPTVSLKVNGAKHLDIQSPASYTVNWSSQSFSSCDVASSRYRSGAWEDLNDGAPSWLENLTGSRVQSGNKSFSGVGVGQYGYSIECNPTDSVTVNVYEPGTTPPPAPPAPPGVRGRRPQAQTGSLQITVAGSGSGRVTSQPSGIDCPGDCSESFPANTTITLKAEPSGESTFDSWGGACAGSGNSPTCQLSVPGNQTSPVTAIFRLACEPPNTSPYSVCDFGRCVVVEGCGTSDCGSNKDCFTRDIKETP